MKVSGGVLLILMLAGDLALAGPVRFRGYSEINQLIRQRLFAPDSSFQLGRYLDESPSLFQPNLLDLLGTFKGDDLGSKFKNGSPNSVNMLLWHFLTASFAKDVSSECGRTPSLPLRPEFRSAVSIACTWPAPAARSHDALETFWTLVMGYDADQSEFLEWQAFIQHATFASPQEAVFSMLLTIMSNPRFLLRS